MIDETPTKTSETIHEVYKLFTVKTVFVYVNIYNSRTKCEAVIIKLVSAVHHILYKNVYHDSYIIKNSNILNLIRCAQW